MSCSKKYTGKGGPGGRKDLLKRIVSSVKEGSAAGALGVGDKIGKIASIPWRYSEFKKGGKSDTWRRASEFDRDTGDMNFPPGTPEYKKKMLSRVLKGLSVEKGLKLLE